MRGRVVTSRSIRRVLGALLLLILLQPHVEPLSVYVTHPPGYEDVVMNAFLAQFTLPLPVDEEIRGNLTLADPLQGCNPLNNANDTIGNIVLIDRGSCQFILKAFYAKNAGASAFLLNNNQANNLIMLGNLPPSSSLISASVRADQGGDTLKDLLLNGTRVEVRLASDKINPANREILVNLFLDLGPWGIDAAGNINPNSYWPINDTSVDPCLTPWPGVSCNDTGFVEVLFLEGFGLSGELPPYISGLSALRVLLLQSNDLTGTFPLASLSSLPLVEVDISNNLWEGLDVQQLLHSIPSTIEEFVAVDCGLVGSLPDNQTLYQEHLSNLVQLDLEFNSISGPLPSAIRFWPAPQILSLASNELSGSVDPSVFTANWSSGYGNSGYSGLKSLQLQSNNFSGSFPATLLNLTGLVTLDVSNNQFTSLPELSNMTSLSIVDASSNQLTEVPWTTYSKVKVLRLADNNIALPSTIRDSGSCYSAVVNNGSLFNVSEACLSIFSRYLEDLDLSFNQILAVPQDGGMRQFLQPLFRVDLSNNRIVSFSGLIVAISSEYQLAPSELVLHHNAFSDKLRLSDFTDQQDSNLVNVRYIDLSHSPFEATIQSTAASGITSLLEEFSCVNCSLEGTIPSFFDSLPRLRSMDFTLNPDMSSDVLEFALAAPDSYSCPFSGVSALLPPFLRCDSDALALSVVDLDLGRRCPRITDSQGSVVVSIDADYHGALLCSCAPGFYRTSDAKCKVCPRNGLCINGEVSAQPGFFPEQAGDQFVMTPCRYAGITVESSSNPCNPQASTNFECAEGHVGRLCSKCDDDHYMRDGGCLPCSDVWEFPALLIISVLLVAGISIPWAIKNTCRLRRGRSIAESLQERRDYELSLYGGTEHLEVARSEIEVFANCQHAHKLRTTFVLNRWYDLCTCCCCRSRSTRMSAANACCGYTCCWTVWCCFSSFRNRFRTGDEGMEMADKKQTALSEAGPQLKAETLEFDSHVLTFTARFAAYFTIAVTYLQNVHVSTDEFDSFSTLQSLNFLAGLVAMNGESMGFECLEGVDSFRDRYRFIMWAPVALVVGYAVFLLLVRLLARCMYGSRSQQVAEHISMFDIDEDDPDQHTTWTRIKRSATKFVRPSTGPDRDGVPSTGMPMAFGATRASAAIQTLPNAPDSPSLAPMSPRGRRESLVVQRPPNRVREPVKLKDRTSVNNIIINFRGTPDAAEVFGWLDGWRGFCMQTTGYYLLIISFLFLPIATQNLQAFLCTESASGESYLASNPHVLCSTLTRSDKFFPLFVYTIGTMTMLIVLTVQYAAHPSWTFLVRDARFFFQRYKPAAFHYGFIIMTQRALLAGIVALISPDSAVKPVLVILLLGGATWHALNSRPYLYERMNFLTVMAGLSQVFVYVATLAHTADSLYTDGASQDTLGWLVFFAHLSVLFTAIYCVYADYKNPVLQSIVVHVPVNDPCKSSSTEAKGEISISDIKQLSEPSLQPENLLLADDDEDTASEISASDSSDSFPLHEQ